MNQQLQEMPLQEEDDFSKRKSGTKIVLISLHGLIRGNDPELGRDSDTGGQVKYVLELARELGEQPEVAQVDLITRQIVDPKVSEDYAQLEEPISDHARIVRIPFGPKRYLRKETLWPYVEVFIDQTISHFNRTGLPDLIHGHYADAGYAGAQLARMLHIPFVLTGHSLGRVKRQRLSVGKKSNRNLERTYKFTTRIEAEEFAIETASLVVASTHQEVDTQYKLYDQYVPDRMEVIPPGVDLKSFYPPDQSFSQPPIADALKPFLVNPDRPMILTMARPDERKNLEMLVKVYGESAQLQDIANLVVVMGSRTDIREMDKSQRNILLNIFTLIDVYNLYGKVAYPKSHESTDVHDLYRLAAATNGVFVNPALTEPFGLTLLEAAASGLPIVATNDGGPRDIIANCDNGLLIDPTDPAAIERALLRTLTEHEQRKIWIENGISGVQEHYSWKQHVKRYLRDVNDIIEHSAVPALVTYRKQRRLPHFDRLLITDMDNTLTGDDEALREFNEMLRENEHIGFGVTTGRSLQDAMALIEELNLPRPDVLDTSVGTELHYGENLSPDSAWQKQISFQWKPKEVYEILASQPGFYPQESSNQSKLKVSFTIDPEIAPKLADIKKLLRNAGLRAKVIMSFGMYVDVIPVRGGSDLSIRHLLYRWGFAPERLLVAGDSGNDEGTLKGRTLGVVVGNYSPELEKLRKLPRIYFAKGKHARGILEGIEYYQFLHHIIIPNDRPES